MAKAHSSYTSLGRKKSLEARHAFTQFKIIIMHYIDKQTFKNRLAIMLDFGLEL